MKEDNQLPGPYSQKQHKSSKKPKILTALLIVLIIAGTGIMYWWLNKQCNEQKKQKDNQIAQLEQSKKDLEKQLDEEKAKNLKTAVTDTTECKTPSDSVVSNVKDSITSGNTAALEGYMATKVTVILAASEGMGERTPSQAVADLTSFIGGPSEWNFSLPEATLNKYKENSYKKYFKDGATVGRSVSTKIISFSYDCNGKINTVFLSPSEDIVLM